MGTQELLIHSTSASGPPSPKMALLLLISLLTPYLSSAAISCYDDNGKPVDWFIVYKLPNLDHVPEGGVKYMYQDGNSSGWVPGLALMNSTDSAVGRTVNQLYQSSQSQEVAYILYNDQPPEGATNEIRGHTKGMILLDKESGFWLVHSTPRFPPSASLKYDFPSNAHRNGQSFLCVTYPYLQFKEIGTQLLYNTITAYDYSVPDPFGNDLPDLKAAAKEARVTSPPWNRQVALTSAGGQTFVSYAKHANFGDDLYSGWVSEALKSNLCVQFWLNSLGILCSNCSLAYHTYNIRTLSFDATTTFPSTHDHSKWCVTWSDGPRWVCIGDINRDRKEEERGGGTVCIQDSSVWKSFHSLVTDYEKCPES